MEMSVLKEKWIVLLIVKYKIASESGSAVRQWILLKLINILTGGDKEQVAYALRRYRQRILWRPWNR